MAVSFPSWTMSWSTEIENECWNWPALNVTVLAAHVLKSAVPAVPVGERQPHRHRRRRRRREGHEHLGRVAACRRCPPRSTTSPTLARSPEPPSSFRIVIVPTERPGASPATPVGALSVTDSDSSASTAVSAFTGTVTYFTVVAGREGQRARTSW